MAEKQEKKPESEHDVFERERRDKEAAINRAFYARARNRWINTLTNEPLPDVETLAKAAHASSEEVEVPKMDSGYYKVKTFDDFGNEKWMSFQVDAKNDKVEILSKPPYSQYEMRELMVIYQSGLGSTQRVFDFKEGVSPESISLGEVRAKLEAACKEGVGFSLDNPLLQKRFAMFPNDANEQRLIGKLYELAAISQRNAVSDPKLQEKKEHASQVFYLDKVDNKVSQLETAAKEMKEVAVGATDDVKDGKLKAVTNAQAEVGKMLDHLRKDMGLQMKNPTAKATEMYEKKLGAIEKNLAEVTKVVNDAAGSYVGKADHTKIKDEMQKISQQVSTLRKDNRIDSMDPAIRFTEKTTAITTGIAKLENITKTIEAPGDAAAKAKAIAEFEKQYEELARQLKNVSHTAKKEEDVSLKAKYKWEATKDAALIEKQVDRVQKKLSAEEFAALRENVQPSANRIGSVSSDFKAMDHEYLKKAVADMEKMPEGPDKIPVIKEVQGRLQDIMKVVKQDAEHAQTMKKLEGLKVETSELEDLGKKIAAQPAVQNDQALKDAQREQVTKQAEVKQALVDQQKAIEAREQQPEHRQGQQLSN